MHCMKCGAEINNSGVFCENCLAEMEKYPVKPNITVTLPERPATPVARKRNRRHKYQQPEDQIRHLRKVRNWLAVLLCVVTLALAGAALMILHLLDGKPMDLDFGRNYSAVEIIDAN